MPYSEGMNRSTSHYRGLVEIVGTDGAIIGQVWAALRGGANEAGMPWWDGNLSPLPPPPFAAGQSITLRLRSGRDGQAIVRRMRQRSGGPLASSAEIAGTGAPPFD